MNLIRDVLDAELMDSNQLRLGKVDGIVAELRPGHPPQLKFIESGWPVKARRIHPRLGAWLARYFPVHRVAWTKITDIGVDTEVNIDGAGAAFLSTERKLRGILTRIPGA